MEGFTFSGRGQIINVLTNKKRDVIALKCTESYEGAHRVP